MRSHVRRALPWGLLLLPCACDVSSSRGKPSVGVAFETLQTPGWVFAFEVLREELRKEKIEMIEAIADGDSSRQFDQVRNMIARRVAGI